MSGGVELLVISGVAGSGKSTALKTLEDCGFHCIDNLPTSLFAAFVDFLLLEDEALSSAAVNIASPGVGPLRRYALLVNCRNEDSSALIEQSLSRLRSGGVCVRVLYFDCQDEIIFNRYKETRRPHPMTLEDFSVRSLPKALAKEREYSAELRALSDVVFDTTSYTPHELRRVLEEYLGVKAEMAIEVVSFGFKFGLPKDADLVIDVRFLPNPHFVAGLRERTGEDPLVATYVISSPEAEEFLMHYQTLLAYVLPKYALEGKRYLRLCVGCTGGRHRSVAIANKVAEFLRSRGYSPSVSHRDVSRVGG